MKYLKLTNSALRPVVDDEEWERCKPLIWCLCGKKNQIQAWYGDTTIKLPNFIMRTNFMYDHKNRDFLDNRKENLRICNYSQNAANSSKKVIATSQHKGVYQNKRDGKWYAGIMKDYKKYWLGSFATEEAAAKAYDKAARKLFGEFANLNFPESGVSK